MFRKEQKTPMHISAIVLTPCKKHLIPLPMVTIFVRIVVPALLHTEKYIFRFLWKISVMKNTRFDFEIKTDIWKY